MFSKIENCGQILYFLFVLTFVLINIPFLRNNFTSQMQQFTFRRFAATYYHLFQLKWHRWCWLF